MASTVGDLSFFSQKVVEWYNSNKRDLPWRGTKDPYAIWVSEIILQQTRVAQGYDYFVRFMRRFPDLASLASASEDEVLAHWQGLGYYSRARNLHKAAVSMQGVFPATYEGVRALAGVGDYTAAAICSLAYDMPYAVVDGNVFRVLSRYFGICCLGPKTHRCSSSGSLQSSHYGFWCFAVHASRPGVCFLHVGRRVCGQKRGYGGRATDEKS